MIEGCLDWQANRLVRPGVVRQATENYFTDQDSFGQWLEEDCDVEVGNTHKWETSATLWAKWKSYAERSGETAGNRKTFAEAMRLRGFEDHRGSGGARLFRGLQFRLRPTDDR